ncbi:MAG: hypothetical protein PW734_04275 [Verrucomicrobium sp.]|nr:hypothetical protein [Verrucomicrobium sp.]
MKTPNLKGIWERHPSLEQPLLRAAQVSSSVTGLFTGAMALDKGVTHHPVQAAAAGLLSVGLIVVTNKVVSYAEKKGLDLDGARKAAEAAAFRFPTPVEERRR